MSSIYGNAERLENVVPELRKVLPGLSAVVGCSSAGAIGMQGKERVVEVSKGLCATSLRKKLRTEEHRWGQSLFIASFESTVGLIGFNKT